MTTTESQNRTVLKALKSGQVLTQVKAAHRFRIYCLAQRIHELRNAGHPINSRLQFDGSRHWSEYWFETATPATQINDHAPRCGNVSLDTKTL